MLDDLASLIVVNLREDGVCDLGHELLKLGIEPITSGPPGSVVVDDDELVLLEQLVELMHSLYFSDHSYWESIHIEFYSAKSKFVSDCLVNVVDLMQLLEAPSRILLLTFGFGSLVNL